MLRDAQRIAYKEGVQGAAEAREEWSRTIPTRGSTIASTVRVRVEPLAEGEAGGGAGGALRANRVNATAALAAAGLEPSRALDDAVRALEQGCADAWSCGPVQGYADRPPPPCCSTRPCR